MITTKEAIEWYCGVGGQCPDSNTDCKKLCSVIKVFISIGKEKGYIKESAIEKFRALYKSITFGNPTKIINLNSLLINLNDYFEQAIKELQDGKQ